MKPNSVSGVAQVVSDLDRSVAFYEAFGFRIGKRDETQATCYVNWFWLELVAPSGATQSGDTSVGPVVYLKVDDLADVAEAARSVGVTPGETRVSSGRCELVVSDPDGYTLVFFTKK